MELLIIIIQEQDYPGLSKAFIRSKIHATKIATEGLYLNKKNITLFMCIEKEREEEVLGYIRENCKERVEERQVSEYNGMMMVDVVRSVKIGGATVIVLDAKNMLKF
ncbi:cyclic-di-AMP receptor [Lacrimispora sp. 210928-DFI.3.58]|uniref:cyclic-di-AMP receptor n=1 Tax=Lacrimispora sp. 210928-DFI.3.58 TaxID=2883214 RepID=UPI0015B782E7|nr:cyclic-di-AMP receptor [Lacrimispora sp. 210928-DFI.3.58]MCB7319233.1 cyclic-di-AMP receptor [Lacrimispora sp. 210928-DFI.3.58]